MRPRKGSDPIVFTTNMVIRGLARRIKDLDDEMQEDSYRLKDRDLRSVPTDNTQ